MEHRGCDSNLRGGCTASNIATWNVRALNEKTDFKLQNLLSEMKRLRIEILIIAETHWTNETAEAFEYNLSQHGNVGSTLF